PVAGRTRTELEGLIGMFVNTQPLRIDLSGDIDTATLLARVRETVIAAQAHQDLPFEQIVEAVAPARSLAHSPLFQVVFGVQNTQSATLALDGLTLTPLTPDSDTAQFDLSLDITESDSGLSGQLNYATALFDAHTIRRFLAYWQTLLRAMVADRHQPVAQIALLPDAERQQVLHGFNDTVVTFPTGVCIHQLFEQQAAHSPDTLAVVFDGESLSYGELNRRANQLAHWLTEQGVRPDDRVAIALARGVDLVVALLATLKAGGAYVPLDPAYPTARLQYMLADSAPTVLITTTALNSQIAADCPVIALDTPVQPWATCPADNISPAAVGLTPHHLAYVIYTSGSTGLPKGVQVEHGSVVNLWTGLEQAVYHDAALQRVSLNASPSFDASVQQLVQLASGRTLVIVPDAIRQNGEQLREWMMQQALEVFDCTPSQLALLMAAGPLPVSLRTVLLGGEAIGAAQWQSLASLEGITCHNVYGPTECTVDSTHTRITGQTARPHIGRPMANRRVYLLDANHQPVPLGVAGEIYIGGTGVACGYLNRPELTAERFLADPFSTAPNARMYKTGDMGRWHADGTIDYLGRNDEQVKIRGFRIEPGEVESAVQGCTGVREAVVVAQRTATGDQRLVAYYTLSDKALTVEALKAQLAQRLPAPMVPSAYVQLGQIPLTPNGKVDRKALPTPDDSAFVRHDYEAPKTAAEQAIATIWQDLLGIERVGRQDHFFELGGHSLMAIKLIERLRQAGYTLAVSDLFRQPTLAALAATLTGSGTTMAVPANLIHADSTHITPAMLPLVTLTQAQIDTVVATVPGGVRNVQDIYPLAPLQNGILFHHLLQPVGDAYITHSILSFAEKDGLDHFIAALQAVIQRHDILRTAIVWEGLDDAVQVVWREAVMPVETLVIQSDDVADALQQRFNPAQLQMNITQAPMIQSYQAADPANNRWLLCLLHHHLCMDHTTLELLLEEVQAHLQGRADQLPAPLPFRQFVALARQQTDAQAQQDYFRAQLGDIDAPCAPFGLLDVQGSGQHIDEHHLLLPDALGQRLRALSQQRGISVTSLFHLAWGRVVQATTGQDNVVFGTVLFGRMAGGEGADRVLGMFLNTLPLRLSLGQTSVEQALRQTHDGLAGLLRFEHAALADVQQCSGVDAQSPLFTSLLNYRYNGGSEQTDTQTELDGIDVLFSQERTNYPVNVSVNDQGAAGFSLDIQVAEGIGAVRVGEMMLLTLTALADALAQAPTQPVHRLTVLPDAERQQVLLGFNDTAADFPADICIHQLFEQQAARQPDAVAVVFDGESLRYGELNHRANQLAHWLIEQGVRPDDRVAIALERSIELVVALLATLKAGGAYVPLDPAYPTERLQYMLADSAPVVLITTTALNSQIAADCPVIALDMPVQPWATCPADNISPAAVGLTPRHLAYVIYTSGSTGQPKGVLVEHRGLCNLSQAQIRLFNAGAGSRVLQFSSLSFDASLFDIVMALCSGAALYLPRGRLLGETLTQFMQQQRISHATLPPAALSSLNPAQALPDLAVLVTAGDAISREAIAPWCAGRSVYNAYGPTEATIWASTFALHQPYAGQPPIGYPVENTKIYLLDGHGQLVPVGVTGEIYIGGVGVARGYLNRPDLTTERFLDDPFAHEPGARMYRTGDLGRWQTDGTLEYLGRNDSQVKIRGFRIEPGEIESCALGCSHVTEAVVLARADHNGQPRLIVWYVGDAEAHALHRHLAGRLPAHMVPAACVQMLALPLTPNGKVDRNALPAPDDSAFVHTDYEAPQTATEQAIATIWQDLLGIERVGRQDHFFELGGHSLLAIKLIERLRRTGYTLAVSELFRQPTLAALATTLTGSEATATIPANRIHPDCEQITPEMLPLVALTQTQIDAVVATVPGGVRNVQDIYPLAPLQTGILFHHLLQPVGDAYITRSILSFAEKDRLDHFIAALQAVIQRHDILRTGIVWEGLDEAVQVVWREAVMPVETLVIQSDDVADALQQRFTPSQLQMNVAQAPMIQCYQVADPANNRWLLCLLHHHLCMDHTTLELLLEEVQAHLLGRADQLPAPLPFRQFVALARQQTAISAQQSAQQDYFRAQLGDIDEPCAPFGLRDSQGNGQHIDEHHLVLSDTLGQRLRALSQQRGISVTSLFHLAWGRVVQATTGQDNVVFGTVLFGRMAGGEGADRVLGMFLNTLPLRLSLGQVSVEQALHQTHDGLAGLLRFEHAALADVQQCSGVGAQSPLFTSLLNYRYNGGSEQTAVQTELDGIDVLFSQERTNYPISVSVNDQGAAGFSLDIQVAEGIGAARVGEMMRLTLTALADALAQAPAQPVHALTVLPDAERQQVLYGFNDIETHFPADICIHQWFEQQAARQPDAVAVVFDGESLRYGELNRRANQLAHWLIEQGVRPDDRVAIALERSVELVVALLATLKAGGAYVPLDPSYPEERLHYILRDSEPVALITTTVLNSQIAADCPVIALDNPARPWATCSADNITPATRGLTPRHLAYVIYTSGSTGLPKGVLVEHHHVVRLLRASQPLFQFGAGDVWTLFHSYAFDFSVWEIWGALLNGGRLVVVPYLVSRSPEAFYQLLCEQDVTVLNQTPSAFRQLMAAQADNTGHHALRYVIFGGEALNPSSLAPWYARAANHRTQLINMYGITETTVHVTWQPLQPADVASTASPIGRRLPDLRTYLLDAQQQPVPIGVIGELYVAGAGVARGYLNRPELTAERFLDDPFAAQTGARMYRSGDLARWNADGTLDYLGRNDHQVKIRGFRIELGEIEAAVRSHAQVTDAVVLARPGQDGEPRLVAWYVGDADVQALRDHIAGQLPAYMTPAVYVSVDALPLTANGKIDQKTLPEPDDSAFIHQTFETPRSAMEQMLAELWQTLLGIERVGRQDHFFELGGHSLLAVKLVSEIHRRGLTLSLTTLFESPRLFELAAALDTAETQRKAWVALRSSGSQRPLFVVPEATGELLYGPPLVAAIDADIPVYGLLGPDRHLPSFTTLQGAAARYVGIIREVQPQGPYRLLGWSLGGTLAYEIAAQLIGLNQSVEFLGLLDTWALPPVESVSHTSETLEQMSQALIQDVLTLRGEPLPTAALATCQQWQDYHALACQQGVIPSDWTPTYFCRWLQHRQDLLNAEYRPQPLPVQVDLLAARDSLARAEPYLHWDRILPPSSIRVTPVPGDHMSLFTEAHVGTVGQQISQAIQARSLPEPTAMPQTQTPVITLQAGRQAGPLLVCIPGAGDNVMSFMALTAAMPDDWQVWGLQPQGLLEGTTPHSSVEAAAQYYLAALKAQPLNGPLHLLGHSFGGWSALELARQLEQEGMPVASLTLVDSRAPQAAKEYPDLQVCMRLITLFEMQGTTLALTEPELAALTQPQRLECLHQRLVECGVMSASSRVQDLTAIFRVFAANLRTGYQPTSLPVVTPSLILAEDADVGRMTGWQTLIPAIQLQRGSGNHVQLLKMPHVTFIADWIQRK
ncbi:non-ribosomal peptide synthetase, partial [Dickeya oryzae]|uniref:non-ribosomal peptide synthetase n=1 Tax=Dickeya oryzae TaxID=1240404 RepID=UPI0021D5BEE2